MNSVLLMIAALLLTMENNIIWSKALKGIYFLKVVIV